MAGSKYIINKHLLLSAAAVLIISGIIIVNKKNKLLFIILNFIFFFLIALVSSNIYVIKNQALQLDNLPQDTKIEGRVKSHPKKWGKDYIYKISVNKLLIGKDAIKIDKSIELETSIKLKRDEWVSFYPGGENIIKIYPENFSAKLFLFRNKIYSTLEKTYYNHLDYYQASLAEAFMLGNRLNVSEGILDNFKKAGIYHLLAISGLHLSILLFLLLKVLSKAKYIFVFLFAFLLAFNFIVGIKASLLRASFMALLMLLSKKEEREYRNENIFFISFSFLLIINPGFFYDLGFWLSFVSMAAIIFIYPLIYSLTGKNNYILRLLFISLSIITATLPLNAHFFNLVPFTSLLSNIIILPVFYIIIIIIIISSAIIIIWPPAGGMLLNLARPFFAYMLKTTSFLAKFDFLTLYFENFPAKMIAIYYILLLLLLLLLYKYNSNRLYGKK